MGLIARFIASIIGQSSPNITLKGAGLILIFYSLVQLFFGFWIYRENNLIIEHSVEYTNLKIQPKTKQTIKIDLKKTMTAPIFMFLRYENFYQNHRVMARSYYQNQLENTDIKRDKLESSCMGADLNSQMGGRASYNLNGKPLNQKSTSNPCGYLPKNFPDDKYVSLTPIGQTSKTDILIDNTSDKLVFKPIPTFKKLPKEQWTDVTNPLFFNWMKISATSKFQKLWGRIEQDIPKGTYNLNLYNSMDPKIFSGKKFVVLSTSNLIGGKKKLNYRTFFVLSFLLFAAAMVLLNLHPRNSKTIGILRREDDSQRLDPSLLLSNASDYLSESINDQQSMPGNQLD